MDDKMRDVIKSAIREFERLSYISPEDIPDIPLYMDQITTFMDAKLAACKRHPEDKIFTKTMINNYTKNKLIPPPDKKKYSRDHLLSLIYVYYLKDFLQISDIKTLLSALNETPFAHREEEAMQSIYDAVFHLVKSQTGYMTKDLLKRWKMAREASFGTGGEEENGGMNGRPGAARAGGSDGDGYLNLFAFVCLLSFDVYVKKKLIETVVDELESSRESFRED